MVAAGALPLPPGFEAPLRLMAVAHGLTVRADLSEPPSGTAAQARAAHLAAVPDGTGDPGSLVIGIGDGGFAPAACHAAAKRGRLLLAESPAEAVERVEKVLAEEPLPRSMTFVGVGAVFGPATVRRLHGLATRNGVPWGVLTGRDASGVAWHVAKQWLSGGRGTGRHLLLHPHDEPPAGPPPDGPVRGLYRSEITPDV
ncbi:MAG: hypothetical protein HOY71_12625, partial [Nonomuraea sp.]|nr:hypothetical protein [Nonomuraea sp.]